MAWRVYGIQIELVAIEPDARADVQYLVRPPLVDQRDVGELGNDAIDVGVVSCVRQPPVRARRTRRRRNRRARRRRIAVYRLRIGTRTIRVVDARGITERSLRYGIVARRRLTGAELIYPVRRESGVCRKALRSVS